MCIIEWLVARISKPYLSHYLNISTVWYSTAVVVWSWDAKASQSNQNVILVVHSGRFSRAGIIFRQQRWRVFCSGSSNIIIQWWKCRRHLALLKARAGIAQMSEKLKTDSISVFMVCDEKPREQRKKGITKAMVLVLDW